jgi:type IV pilus assembly protein PilB
MEDVVKLLDRTVLFADLHPSHKQQVASVMERRRYGAGEVIFEEGQPGDALYVVETGKVEVFARNPQMGVDFELARLGAGQVFGEMALVTEEPRSASVRAAEPTTCVVLPLPVFVKICDQLPDVIRAVARTLARRLKELNREQGISFASLSSLDVDPAAYGLVPAELLQKHRMIPLRLEGNRLLLAMVDPGNTMGFDDVRRCLHGVDVKPIAIGEEDYRRYLERNVRPSIMASGPAASVAAGTNWRQLRIFSDAEEAEEDRRAASAVTGREVVDLLNQILAEAVDREASDVHIDVERLSVHVRLRIDGSLVERDKAIPRSHYRPLISRIKIVAGMDIAEQRLPQDGRISFSYDGRDYDVRVASMPVRGGERIALRLLDATSGVLELSSLVLADKLAQVVRRMVFRPNGAVLVTGPTGSGKTTTLYALLTERTRYARDLNIMTVEDPIEFDLPGISQVQVNEGAGLSFPRVLRGFLRHDPDAILVGETRDGVTAKIAMEASITGHLVLTSMHTNSALGSVLRLRDMGIEPYMIANAVTGVVSQRLVRRICPVCSEKADYPSSVVENLERTGLVRPGEEPEMVRENGCENCAHTGFRGRVGVYEVLQMTDGLRHLIGADVPMSELRAEAEGHGMVTLPRYAGFLLKHGLTVPSEALRILSVDE